MLAQNGTADVAAAWSAFCGWQGGRFAGDSGQLVWPAWHWRAAGYPRFRFYGI